MRLAIHTERLRLRAPEDGDAEGVARMFGDFSSARTSGSLPHPYPFEAAQGWIALAGARHRLKQAFTFLMEGAGANVVGQIGVFRRTPEQDWEIGYTVAAPFRRRGYAREALTAVLGWADRDLGLARITAGVFEDNEASAKLLAAAGFTPTGETCDVYSLARSAHVRCIGLVRKLTGPAAPDSRTSRF